MEATAFSSYQQNVQVSRYLNAFNVFLAMYCFTVAPNLYSFIVSIYLLCAMPSSAIWVYFINLVLIALYPVCATFLTGSYILLTMLTYFPYKNNREHWQMVCHYTLPPALLLVTYSLQYFAQKATRSKSVCFTILSLARRGRMGPREPEIPMPRQGPQPRPDPRVPREPRDERLAEDQAWAANNNGDRA